MVVDDHSRICPSEDHSIRTRIETLKALCCATNIRAPQKIIPLEQGLKRAGKHLSALQDAFPQKIIPLEQGLKPFFAGAFLTGCFPQKIIPLEQGLKRGHHVRQNA